MKSLEIRGEQVSPTCSNPFLSSLKPVCAGGLHDPF